MHVVEALSHTNEESLINSFALPRKGLRQRYARDLLALYQGLAPVANADTGADDGGGGEGGAGEQGASMPTGAGPHARAANPGI